MNGRTPSKQSRLRRVQRRAWWVMAVGLGLTVSANHWVWAVIAALLTVLLAFALDDEAIELRSSANKSSID